MVYNLDNMREVGRQTKMLWPRKVLIMSCSDPMLTKQSLCYTLASRAGVIWFSGIES